MNLNIISKYRGELMGFAIIIVMLFHVPVPRSSDWYGLVRMGNLGVDIFFFLSGIGLWYSWSKMHEKNEACFTFRSSLFTFYLNRAKRIYPAWLIIAGYFYISRFNFSAATTDSWINLFGQVFFNWNFWRFDELTFWYVPATMMMYLFAPFYMELVRRNDAFRWLVVLPLMWCIIVQYVTPIHAAVGHIEIFWSRVPIFFLGINIAEAVRQKRQLDCSTWYLVVFFFIVSLSSCVWLEQMRHGKFPLYVERMLYIPLAITTILIMSAVFERLATALQSAPRWLPSGTGINAFFTFVGGISLEIYLLHAQYVLNPLAKMHLGYWPTFLLTFAISVPIAWLISKLCKKIIP